MITHAVQSGVPVAWVWLRPLPAEPYPTWLTLTPRVDRHARVAVWQCFYSVPARKSGRKVSWKLAERP